MSAVVGLQGVHRRLDTYKRALEQRLADAVETAARDMQKDLVALAPVKDGDVKGALESSDALRITRSARGEISAQVGFLTAAQKKRAFHAYFVEFGTKGYVKGQKRFSGRARGSGRVKLRKVTRGVPARPAHPFFRPAYQNLKRNLERLRAEAHARALADCYAGRANSDWLLGR